MPKPICFMIMPYGKKPTQAEAGRGVPEIDFNGLLENLGATVFSVPRARVSQNYQILDNFTWIRGKHTLKFGDEFRRVRHGQKGPFPWSRGAGKPR